MIFNSIKWRLQIWYGLILVLVLVGFGVTAYRLEYNQRMHRLDGELQRRFKMVADSMHQRGPRDQAGPPFDGPPDQMERPPRTEQNRRSEKYVPSSWLLNMFSTNQPGNFYFEVTRNGEVIAGAGPVPLRKTVETMPYGTVHENRGPDVGPKPPPAFTTDGYREMEDWLPGEENIRVGCPIAGELKELHRTALEFLLLGAVILSLGLAGGAWFISRALRPIDSISNAAVKISAGDLAQRINVADTESELGRVATVLNSTFARLESAFKQQKQFASDAAHELRTPVSVILTQTQTALNRKREPEEYRQTIEACQRAAQRMKRLISTLLELARLDAGQEALKRMSFDLASTVNDCVEMIQPMAEECHVKLSAELEPAKLRGDPDRMAQVVTNLLTNAIKYNRDGGAVRAEVKVKGGFAILTVADTGRGISPEDLPHVFDRFYRGDKSRSGGNSGLGLAISKAIVEAHGGSVEVASEEDKGTTFTVRLPI